MSRTIDAALVTQSQAATVRAIHLARLDFSGGLVTANDGANSITYNSETYTALGNLAIVDTLEEATDVKPYSIRVGISGVAAANIAIALDEDYQGRSMKLYIAFLDSNHDLIDAVLFFDGRMDVMDINLGDTADITIVGHSKLADWQRPRITRYTHQDQISRYSADLGLEFVSQQVEKDLIWGRERAFKTS